MNLIQTQTIFDTIYPIPEASVVLIKDDIEPVFYKKGEVIFEAGKIETNIYFIKKGIVRAYAYHNDLEVTFWFGSEGETILSMKNYVQQTRSYESIEALEDVELYKISGQKLQELYLQDIYIANWGRKLAEMELLKTEQHLISRQFKSATERYTELINRTPHLLQRVALGHIASYLGITQVSLSRIRSEMK